MKKIIVILLTVVVLMSFAACGNGKTESTNTETEEAVEEVIDDEVFLKNLATGLEERWAFVGELTDEKVDQMSEDELRATYEKLIDVELNALGKHSDYDFKDEVLSELADMYIEGLELQREGVKYVMAGDAVKQEETWTMGYYYRTVAIGEIYNGFGISVSDEYKDDLAEFIAEYEDIATAIENGELPPELSDLPPTMEYIRANGFTGEMDGIVVDIFIVPEAQWNDEVIAYRCTNTTNKDLLVGLSYVGYDKDGEWINTGGGSTMYIKAGESGVDYVNAVDERVVYFETEVNSRAVDARTKEKYEYIYSEETNVGGGVDCILHFPPDGMSFRYVIAYTDAEGKIISCDSINGSGDGSDWYDSLIAPEQEYENFETSIHDSSI